jgi:hypothetical protein
MTIEGLRTIYPEHLDPIDPAAADVYLTDIPKTDVFNAPAETIKGGAAQFAARVERVTETIRTIETSRVLIGYHGSVLGAIASANPEAIAGLPEDLRAQVLEIVSRMAVEQS